MINYYCPDFFVGLNVYPKLLELYGQMPEVFYPDVRIKSVYGCFPNMTWNGGGMLFGQHVADIDNIINYFEIYKAFNITIQLTFTNPLLEESDCYDRYGNTVLKLINDNYSQHSEVLISSDILEKYIRDMYPNIKLSKSIIAAKNDYDFKDALTKYHNIVMPIRHLKNFELFNSFTDEEKTHIELLCNDPCPVDCPRLYTHYPEFAKATLLQTSLNTSINCKLLCDNPKAKDINSLNQNSNVGYEIIKNSYVTIGMSEFKISGRGSIVNIVTSIIPYLIKSDYQVGIIRMLLLD